MVIVMEQKSKNEIRMILVLFLFGMSLIAMGLGLVTKQGFTLYGILGLVLASAGVLLLAFGIRSLKNSITLNPNFLVKSNFIDQ